MITFKTIKWKNFLSTGNIFTEVQLDNTKTTLILGENGAGKSTLLDALTFVLFNKPYRSINLPQLVNSVNEKDCVVEMTFSKGSNTYRVVRGQSPKIFEIWEDGKLVDQDAKAKDYQKFLEEQVLGMSYKSFCQVVILGSANYVPFMRLSAADRRSVVESILDIGVFSVMNVHLRERISQNKEELTLAESDLVVAREKVSSVRRMIEEDRKRSEQDDAWKAAQEAEAKDRIQEARRAIEEMLARVASLTASVDDEDELDSKMSKFSTLRSQIAKKSSNLRKEIDFYRKNDSCPTCSQKIDEDFKNKSIEKSTEKADEMEKALEEMDEHIKQSEARLAEIKKTMREVQNLNSKIATKENEIENIDRHLKAIASKKAGAVSDLQQELSQALANENESIDSKKELVEDQHYLHLAQSILRDSGIKARIIKNYIPVINDTINRYLSLMNFFVNFNLDEEFTETIKSRHRDDFTYASFSEGEKKKIDLSLLFAWRAIAGVRNSIKTNLLLLDEILDGSLDDGGTEAFLEIVSQMDGDTNIFVISHKPKELLQDKFDRTIQFVKKSNFSRQV
jgi:DNA repair exonuclease SbcCD ATPase subunit